MRALPLLFLLALSACTSLESQRGDAALQRQAVADAANAWVAAYNSRDPARIVALYETDAVFWGTTSPTIRTTAAEILDYFKDAPKRPNSRVAIDSQHIRIAGDMAFSSGSYTFSDLEGKSPPAPSRFTFIFRYRDGQWRLIHQHSSRVAPPRT